MKFTKATTRLDSSAMMLTAALLVSICLVVDGASGGAGAAMIAMPQDRAAQSGLDRQSLAQLMQRITSAARRGLGLVDQPSHEADWAGGATPAIRPDSAVGLLPLAHVRLIPPDAVTNPCVILPTRPNLTDLPPPIHF